MKKLVLFMFALVMGIVVVNAKGKEEPYTYELSLAKENVAATAGYKVFKVWSYCKKKEVLTQEVCMQNAVKGLLFKGLAASDYSSQGNVPALVPDGYDTHKEYFDNFFNSGDYRQFIQLTSKGAQQAGDVVKTANKEWKVGLLVQVNVNALRKRLEKDGIVEGVKGIFSR